jgi:DNA-binding NtrC family response regulator
MLKLLIVDDDPGVREGLALGLSDSFEIGQSSGGSDALRRLESEHPDVILLDQNMEGVSGTSVLESISGHSGAPAVVMFSATMDVGLVRRALKLGAQDCVAKPFSLEELRGKLESAARSRVAPGQARRPFTVRVVDLLDQESEAGSGSDLEQRRREFARDLLREALHDTAGDYERAAGRLGMAVEDFKNSLQTLSRRGEPHVQ